MANQACILNWLWNKSQISYESDFAFVEYTYFKFHYFSDHMVVPRFQIPVQSQIGPFNTLMPLHQLPCTTSTSVLIFYMHIFSSFWT